MTWGIRSCALAAAAAALLSAQAAYAAPTPARVSGIDPLVSLSVLGTQQSRAAVCSAATPSAACNISASMMPAAAVAATAAAQDTPPPPKAFGIWPALLGLAVLIAIVVAITQGGNNGSGDLTPVSPA
jgi:hypothetical protein